jgi:hypothetical protein
MDANRNMPFVARQGWDAENCIAQRGFRGEHATVTAAQPLSVRVAAYLQDLRRKRGWSREHAAAMIRQETGGTTTTNTYRRWELSGNVPIVDLEAAVSVLGGSLADLVGANGSNGEQLAGEQLERRGFDADSTAPTGRGGSGRGGLEHHQRSSRRARRATQDRE